MALTAGEKIMQQKYRCVKNNQPAVGATDQQSKINRNPFRKNPSPAKRL